MVASELTAAESQRQPNVTAQRIGVYDSRAVAYAWFWTPEQQQKLKEQTKAAEAAKAAGQEAKYRQLANALEQEQKKLHRQVFSTAPADEALTVLKNRTPEIQKQARVSALISKWDKPALKRYGSTNLVDVTDLLVQEFKPTKDALKTIEEIKRQKPAALDQVEKLRD